MNDLSVVVPARDAEGTVAAAVGSVLERADGLLEVLVVDDGSTDATVAVVEQLGDPRVRVLTGRGAGPSAARNDGVAAARGDVLAFADADDLWCAGRPDPRRAVLTPDGVARGRARIVREGSRSEGVITHLSTVLVPAPLARRHPFDESLLRGEDVEWFLRIADAGVAVTDVDAVVMDYVLRPGSLTDGQQQSGLLPGLAAAVRRRRAEEIR